MHRKSPFYREGYKYAARELSNNFRVRETKEKDTIVFPVIFLHRHYIELPLKDLISEIVFKFRKNMKPDITPT